MKQVLKPQGVVIKPEDRFSPDMSHIMFDFLL